MSGGKCPVTAPGGCRRPVNSPAAREFIRRYWQTIAAGAVSVYALIRFVPACQRYVGNLPTIIHSVKRLPADATFILCLSR